MKIPVLDKNGVEQSFFHIEPKMAPVKVCFGAGWFVPLGGRDRLYPDAAYVVLFVFMPDFAGSKRKENVLRAIK